MNVAHERQDQNGGEQKQAHDYVEGMEANQTVIRGAKQISTDGEMVVHNETPPLHGGAVDEITAKHNGEQHPETERAHVTARKSTQGRDDREGTGDQRPGIHQNRLDINHFAWQWTGRTFTDVKQIRHDEAREEPALGENETRHTNLAAARRTAGN